jgi:hypothetical protein
VQLLFAATILLSAALMFIVEPMFAKMVLPRLGGAPSVWNTCLVFYQAALMAGYIYAHLSLKWLGPRRQALLHVALICLPLCFLPIQIREGWTPPAGSNPVGWLLVLLSVCVGLPFLSLAASAPVLQTWFSQCGGRSAKDPYFLYAASNLGSLGGLAAYPLWIEPHLQLQVQAGYWKAGYCLLLALFALCAAALWWAGSRSGAISANPHREHEDTIAPPNAAFQAPVTLRRRLHWLALSLVPSALLMGVTAHLTVDLASQPLLWAIPLGLYLLSFIMVFARWPILKWLWLLRIIQAIGLVAAAGTVYLESLPTERILGVAALHLAAFFLTSLVCHGTMAADRPATSHLTEYYIWMSAGGVAGGLLCALVAPLIFTSVVEYPLMLAAACLLGPQWPWRRLDWLLRWFDWALLLLQGCVFAFVACALWDNRLSKAASGCEKGRLKDLATDLTGEKGKIGLVVSAAILAFLLQRNRYRFTAALAALLGISLLCCGRENVIYMARSFFGVLRVQGGQYEWGDDEFTSHSLMHGSTLHGEQSFDPAAPDDALDPWTYYHRTGPVGDVFNSLERRQDFLLHGHIGVVGLGTGTMAAYAQKGQTLTYFEIDAAVRQIAQDPQYFTYLTNCRVTPEIRMGDARLTLAAEPNLQFDVLLIDAFSSDAIPVHLLTHEAMQMYFEKLAPHGLLMVHLSNRHLYLAPVVARSAAEMNVVARLRNDDDESELGKTGSEWAVLARNPEDFGSLNNDVHWTPLESQPGDPLWTDDFSSIVSVMNWDWLPKWMRREK